ncbi:hypothetical protein ACFC1R_34445 [Kitasatospora sp. NPDC056138]|uniref:hypothetical protein n=1 Tax=Kitasatospora sp. NPDC056138 TaxID=3345724 RepID=UPI0035DBC572
MTGSWRRLVFANPDIEPGCVEKAAYSACVLAYLHRRDLFARKTRQLRSSRTLHYGSGHPVIDTEEWQEARRTAKNRDQQLC